MNDVLDQPRQQVFDFFTSKEPVTRVSVAPQDVGVLAKRPLAPRDAAAKRGRPTKTTSCPSPALLSEPSVKPLVSPEEATSERLCEVISACSDLPLRRRTLFVGAIQKVSGMVALALQHGAPRPSGPGTAVLTCATLNPLLWRHPPKTFGVTKATMQNTVSAMRQALQVVGLADPLPRGPARLAPDWRLLYEAVLKDHEWRARGLVGFAVYCSERNIAPTTVSDAILAAYAEWLTGRTLQRDITSLVRRTASNWNWAASHVPGWPRSELHRANARDEYRLRLDEGFPASLLADAERYLGRLAQGEDGPDNDLYDDGKGRQAGPPTPRRPRTVETRRYQLEMAVTALVASGVSRDDIRTLRDLVDPISRPVAILRFHLERTRRRLETEGREVPSVIRTSNLSGIAEVLRQVAKFHCGLPEAHVNAITERQKKVQPKTEGRMTEKNLRRVRRLLEPANFARLLHLPAWLMRQARKELQEARTREKGWERRQHEAGRLAMHAALLEIGIFCPMRRDNLFNLRLDTNLERDGQSGRISRIQVDRTKVDGVHIDWPVEPETDALLREYLQIFRPILAAPGNPFLFPGQGLKARDAAQLATDLKDRVGEVVGAEFNIHLMRHLAVARFLRRHPGRYGVISKALGHKKISTTIAFYAGLEMDATAKLVNQAVFEDRQETRLQAQALFRKPGRLRGKAP